MKVSKIIFSLKTNKKVRLQCEQRSYIIINNQARNMAMVESTLSSVLKKHEGNPYNSDSKPQYTFYVQLPNSQDIFKTQLLLQPLTLVQDALILAIQEFNIQLASEGKTLVKKIDFYVPRLPKKNGKARTDMPCLDIHQRLLDIKITSISIQIKEPQFAIIPIKVNHQQFPTKKSDTKSTILVQMTQRSAKSSKKYSEQIQDQNQFVKSERKNECFCSFC